MNHSIYSADRMTHLKIVVVALVAGILVAGFSFPAQTGIIAVSAVWLGIYPLLLVWEN